MEHLLTVITFLLGFTTVVLSIVVARYFRKRKAHMGRHAGMLTNALEWQLVGEAVIGFGTLIFASASASGAIEEWSTTQTMTLRIIMFTATSVTTIHLYRVARRLREL